MCRGTQPHHRGTQPHHRATGVGGSQCPASSNPGAGVSARGRLFGARFSSKWLPEPWKEEGGWALGQPRPCPRGVWTHPWLLLYPVCFKHCVTDRPMVEQPGCPGSGLSAGTCAVTSPSRASVPLPQRSSTGMSLPEGYTSRHTPWGSAYHRNRSANVRSKLWPLSLSSFPQHQGSFRVPARLGRR